MYTDIFNSLLKGYGSYLTGAVAVVYGGGNLVDVWGTLDAGTAAVMTVLGFGIVFLRRALESIGLTLTKK